MTLRKGQDLPARTFGPITRSDIVRYQGASGDFNPIHHDEPFAREAGYGAVISVGMLQAGYVAAFCVEHFGPNAIREFRVRFADVVVPGDVLTCRGKVTDVTETDGKAVARVELSVERGETTVLTGGALVTTAESV